MLTPRIPVGKIIGSCLSKVLREIKQALQLKHNKLAQHREGFQGSMRRDKAITSRRRGAPSVLILFPNEYTLSEFYFAESSKRKHFAALQWTLSSFPNAQL